jgi:hypothetical protein
MTQLYMSLKCIDGDMIGECTFGQTTLIGSLLCNMCVLRIYRTVKFEMRIIPVSSVILYNG